MRIRLDSRPVSIFRNNNGTTLVEIVAAVIITGTVMLGMGVAYVFGLGTWQKTVARVHLQQTGTYAVQELSQALQGAKTVALSDNQLSIAYPPEFGLPATVFRLSDSKLFRDADGLTRQIAPQPEKDNRYTVQSCQWQLSPMDSVKTVNVQLVLQYAANGYSEAMNFETTVFTGRTPNEQVK